LPALRLNIAVDPVMGDISKEMESLGSHIADLIAKSSEVF
jgi:hypothetical protein